MPAFVRTSISAVQMAPQSSSPVSTPLGPGSLSKSLLPSPAAAPAPAPTPAPSTSQVTPVSLYPDLPLGGEWDSLIAYFIQKGVPTYKFADLAPDQVCVAFGFLMVDLFIPIPCMYLYLDNSLVAQDDYYIYRYLNYGVNTPVPATAGPVDNSPGPLTLIVSNTNSQPQDGYFPTMGNSGAPFTLNNPMLTQETLGQPPIIQLSVS